MKDYEEKVLNIMDSAKDNIRTQLDKAYKSGYEDAKSELAEKAYKDGYETAKLELGKKVANIAHEENDKTYQRGLEDAWEVARKIILNDGLSLQKLKQIFNTSNFDRILKENTASEAIAKIKEYEEQQKQDIIQVGDEVFSEDLDLTFVVTRIITSKRMDNTVKRYEGMCIDGACYDNLPEDIVKTGRTFPQITEVFVEMKKE